MAREKSGGAAFRWILRAVIGIPFLLVAYGYATYMIRQGRIVERRNEAIGLYDERKYDAAIALLETVRTEQQDLDGNWFVTIARPILSRPSRPFEKDLAKFHYARGDALHSRGEPGKAREAYRTVLDLDPAYPGVYLRLAEAARELKDWKAGLEAAKKAKGEGPSAARAEGLERFFEQQLRSAKNTP
jgi:tetratricopeptide (TPR) repeat protein